MISLAPLHREQQERSAPREEPVAQYEPASAQQAVARWISEQPALAVTLAALVGLAAGFVVKRVFRGS